MRKKTRQYSCSKCGKPIIFINCNRTNVMMNAESKYYTPAKPSNGGEPFFMANGKPAFGIVTAGDGIKGYKPHRCV